MKWDKPNPKEILQIAPFEGTLDGRKTTDLWEKK